ncbi:MAG TPA: cytochrome c [Phycisphaerales bacterium]|nr:cytochrome c [Phycisphaerales bacterium]
MKRAILTTGAALLAGGLLAAPLAGCRGDRTDKPPRRFFPDLDDQPKWDPQETTPFYTDGIVGRQTPAHAVAFASVDFDPVAYADEAWAKPYLDRRADMLAEDDAVYRGVEVDADGVATYVDEIPVEVTRPMVERGRHMFNIYCVACHGYLGDGKGMVGARWNYPPANLTGDVYRDRANRQGKDGYIFHIIRDGLDGPDGANRMPEYGHAIGVMDAWAVVAYVRSLQKARGSDWADLPENDRKELGEPTPPAGGGGDQTKDGGAS